MGATRDSLAFLHKPDLGHGVHHDAVRQTHSVGIWLIGRERNLSCCVLI